MLCRLGLSVYNTERLIVGVNVSENCTSYTSKITFVDFENKNTVSPFESLQKTNLFYPLFTHDILPSTVEICYNFSFIFCTCFKKNIFSSLICMKHLPLDIKQTKIKTIFNFPLYRLLFFFYHYRLHKSNFNYIEF